MVVAHLLTTDRIKMLATNVAGDNSLTNQIKGLVFTVIVRFESNALKDLKVFGANLTNKHALTCVGGGHAVLVALAILAHGERV